MNDFYIVHYHCGTGYYGVDNLFVTSNGEEFDPILIIAIDSEFLYERTCQQILITFYSDVNELLRNLCGLVQILAHSYLLLVCIRM